MMTYEGKKYKTPFKIQKVRITLKKKIGPNDGLVNGTFDYTETVRNPLRY